MTLQIGDSAPDYTLLDQNGIPNSLKDLMGKTTLIYFYPKDETPGCTTQACSLRDNFKQLKSSGIDVIGVSNDDVASHMKFATKHSLPFTLLADSSKEMITAYGAWGEKSMYGRKYEGTIRSAVLIGPDLKILAVWPKIQPLKTVAEVEKWLNSNK